ncbi:hypothetical protein BOTBODRAFT_104404, partial [Botryobasidium botryosum FD-172 SS1]
GLPHLMSPLMQNGTAGDFVRKNPNINRLQLVSALYLSISIAQGLEYMHTQDPPIIHGDLKANNILVSEDGSACLSDFGLSRTSMEFGLEAALATSDERASITMAYHANFRWGAPEVLLDDRCRTPASDIFSLGRLKVELLTGKIPFLDLTDHATVLLVAAGRYDRPIDNDAVACGLDDEMWALITECWNRDPLRRPSASQVVERLRRMPEPASVHPSWKPCVRTCDGGSGSSSSSMSISLRAADLTADSAMDVD